MEKERKMEARVRVVHILLRVWASDATVAFSASHIMAPCPCKLLRFGKKAVFFKRLIRLASRFRV